MGGQASCIPRKSASRLEVAGTHRLSRTSKIFCYRQGDSKPADGRMIAVQYTSTVVLENKNAVMETFTILQRQCEIFHTARTVSSEIIEGTHCQDTLVFGLFDGRHFAK